jgi:hypothetical protein
MNKTFTDIATQTISITNILNSINNSFTNIHHIPFADQTTFNENIINNNKSAVVVAEANNTTTTNSVGTDPPPTNNTPISCIALSTTAPPASTVTTISNDQVNLNQNHIHLDNKNSQNGKVTS